MIKFSSNGSFIHSLLQKGDNGCSQALSPMRTHRECYSSSRFVLVIPIYKGLHKRSIKSLFGIAFSHRLCCKVVYLLLTDTTTPFVLSRQLSNIGLAEYNLTGLPIQEGGCLPILQVSPRYY